MFASNPRHPSLQFHEARGNPGVYSARVGAGYRALCRRDGETVIWFWVGTHSEYDRRINQRVDVQPGR